MSYAAQHMAEAAEIISKIDVNAIEKMADLLATVKEEEGRIFFLGVGGSAGNCSHAVNDFRKIVEILDLVCLLSLAQVQTCLQNQALNLQPRHRLDV